MKASRFSDAQKAFILKQGADGMPVADICRKAGISQATYFNWKKKYDGLLPTEMRRLKQLEDENGKLKQGRRRPVPRQRDAAGRSSAENFEACPEAQAGRRHAWRVGRVDPQGVSRVPGRYVHLPLQVSSPRTGPPRTTDQGYLPDAGALRLPAGSCPAAAGRLAARPEQDAAHLSRIRPAIAQQNAEASGQGQAA